MLPPAFNSSHEENRLAQSASPSSSNSTTPPSEATLADFESLPIAEPSSSNKLVDRVVSNPNQINKQVVAPPAASFQIQSTSPNAINTDWESSAAEDGESFTLMSKYESAEFAFLSYSRTNKVDKLKALLDAKLRGELSLNLNSKGQQKHNMSWSALHLACYFGHIQIVEQILSKKLFRDEIDINIQNHSGDTPLHKATLTNRVQIVQLLLSNGANVFIKNCDGLLAKQLTNDEHILDMLEAAEQADKNSLQKDMFKAVDNGDLRKLQEYFDNYDFLRNIPQSLKTQLLQDDYHVQDETTSGSIGQASNNTDRRRDGDHLQTTEFINQMTDERGNTLLHLAAMRGFQAICVYLLERGLDPYRTNNLGQTCVDLSSHQLRQLFMSVKPASSQLKKLSKERVTRFEGPLMKKVRILGWKQIYVVLENGAVLLFNNRRDSMNKSRRGYKYLESATCVPDANDLSVFTLCFSDRSRATFLISQDHLSHYVTFTSSSATNQPESQHSSKLASLKQIELVRQKWIDSINDHIVYSTEFIRKGLKIDDDDLNDGQDIANLNHLLPIDTIKSFVHEARAHYSILERHADSLCNLVQAFTTNETIMNQSIELSQRELERSQTVAENNQQQASVSSTTTTGSRSLLGFMRSARPARSSISTGSDDATGAQVARNSSGGVGSSLSSSTRLRNNSLTGEFVQESWPCLLFHLRLLSESAENTKTSMSQALALMEHQEQLRQNRIQDQEERCRVLEDSLHTLARDHHQLEKSLSMSQIYHSVVGSRSMSMSTDLNEYYDAFEDFDDEKTMTPTSMPSDEELDRRINDVMNGRDLDEKEERNKRASGTGDGSPRRAQPSFVENYFPHSNPNDLVNDENEGAEEDDDEDLQSNCSALTVETVTEQQYLSAAADDDSRPGYAISGAYQARTRLPAPMVPRDQVSIWSILKNCIGKELSKITMPVVFNEPLTMLQRACEGIQYSNLLKRADQSDDPVERMELVCAFIIASISPNCRRIVKPFNPLLYETYEIESKLEDGKEVRTIAQQVSHHPPITAANCDSDYFSYSGIVNPKIKFWGRSVEVTHDGSCQIFLKRHKETYVFKAVACSLHNIIVGKLWFEHHGPLDVRCVETNVQANLVLKPAGWFSNDVHRFDGFITTPGKSEPKKERFVYGKWSDYIKSVDYAEYQKYMEHNPQKLFKIPDNPDTGGQDNELSSRLNNMSVSGSSSSNNNNSIQSERGDNTPQKTSSTTSTKTLFKGSGKKGDYTKSESAQSLDIPNSRILWKSDAQYLEEYYNFTLFTMKMNDLNSELEKKLPRTDSRFRPDVRKLEEGDIDAAANEKQRLEDKQREIRSRDKRFKDPHPDFLWFEYKDVPYSKEKTWLYKGGYWENRCNQEKFPDLF